MGSRLLLDNWTLQNAGELLSSEVGTETTQEIVFSTDGQSFRYAEISHAEIALECLCQLLHNIVFAEDIFVDASFTSSWEEYSAITLLANERIIKPKPLNDAKAEWLGWREVVEDQLCFCPQIRAQHQQNKNSYAATRQTVDRMLSQVLWGGAGMLARASYLRVPYVPHPLRQRLLARAQLLTGPTDASIQLAGFVEAQRTKIFQRIDESGFFAELRVPPIVIEIVESASSLGDVVLAALALRSTYRELRGWIGELQAALDADDTQELLSRRNVLESVSRNIDRLSGTASAGDVSIRFGLSWLNVTTKVGAPVNTLQNKLGVRAQINRLILAPAGRRSLQKLLTLLGLTDNQALFLKSVIGSGQ